MWLNTLRGGIPYSTVRGMTSNGRSAALLEESFALAVEPERGRKLRALGTLAGADNTCPGTRTWVEGEEEDAPNFGTLPQARRSFLTESEVFRFTLRDFRYSVSTRAKSSPLVGLVAEGPTGLAAEGPTRENFVAEGGEGLKAAERVDLKLEGPGISDLISSE